VQDGKLNDMRVSIKPMKRFSARLMCCYWAAPSRRPSSDCCGSDVNMVSET